MDDISINHRWTLNRMLTGSWCFPLPSIDSRSFFGACLIVLIYVLGDRTLTIADKAREETFGALSLPVFLLELLLLSLIWYAIDVAKSAQVSKISYVDPFPLSK